MVGIWNAPFPVPCIFDWHPLSFLGAASQDCISQGGSVIVFCSSRNGCETTAIDIARCADWRRDESWRQMLSALAFTRGD